MSIPRIILSGGLLAVLTVASSAPGPIGLCARANELGGQAYQEPQHATPLVPQGKQEQGGLVQKQGAQSPPPAIYNCLNQPKASQNTQNSFERKSAS